MGFSFGVLAVAIALSAFAMVLDRNGRKADRERRRRSR